MPDSKTIEIDEIVTPEKPTGGGSSDQRESGKASENEETFGGQNPFKDFQKALPWKARITLKLTQWFMLLRSKSWGKWIIVPAILLAVLLIIPLGILFILAMMIRSIFRSPR
ncbi:MAG: hypothetical protein ACPG32_06885 [Akkermansiaceae bacterium]